MQLSSSSINSSSIITSAIWPELLKLAKSVGSTSIRDLFNSEPNRAQDYVYTGADITVDLSRQRIDQSVIDSLIELALERNLAQARQEMFSGIEINSTENRSVLHTALRKPKGQPLYVNGEDVTIGVHEVLAKMKVLAEQVRNGKWLGATNKPIRNIVNIGIGGSDLGPVMAFEALRPYAQKNLDFYFVSNVDGTDINQVLNSVELEETLFIIASKTFSTQETMLNANTAKSALLEKLNTSDNSVTARHFVAVSTNSELVERFGIDPQNMFGFWEWVGGRYSLESAIGLSTMIAIGPDNFAEMLAGFNAMDEHFYQTDFNQNLPVLIALIGIWNRSLLDIPTVAFLPYDQNLKRFPAYLQQLTMESNGKSVTRSGDPVGVQTSAIYWGEPGTNGQHSFYQLLHQGTQTVACEILVTAKTHSGLVSHHDVLVSNALSQASVFAFGRTEQELQKLAVAPDLIPHKVISGNKPTTLITVDLITPYTLGSLVALYEHVVFVQGIMWGINSFDQWGVELGKEVANSISPFLKNEEELDKFDSATKRAINWYRENREK